MPNAPTWTKPANATITVNGKTYAVTAIGTYADGSKVTHYFTGKRHLTKKEAK